MTATVPSYWLDPPPQPDEPLEGRHEAEVVIVGAGYTGLSAAIALAERGVSVTVVEQEYAGYGASGRNAGHLTPTIGKDLPSVLKAFGRETGGALARLADEAVEHTEATIADRGIDCDYQPTGNVVAGLHPRQEKKLRRAAAAGIELGAQLQWLSTEELDARGLPAFVACGYFEQRGGVLHPGKYVRGLRDAAIGAGATIYERSAVTAVEENGDTVIVRCDRGEVSAKTCLLATNAYSRSLGYLRRLILPLRVGLVITQPLTAAQRERVGWPGEEGVYTAHESLESYRITADGRISFGSRPIRYHLGGRVGPDDSPRHFAKIKRNFRRRFPEIEDVEFDHEWSGPLAFPFNFLPSMGRAGRGERIFYSMGCVGHGLAMSSHLGTLAAGMLLGENDGPEVLANRRKLPLPPEPLLWASVHAIAGTLNAIDRVTDMRARPRK